MLIYRNVASVMSASLMLQIAAGVLGVSLPLAMAMAGWSGMVIGMVIAGYGAGFMAGAWIAPKVIRTIGHIRAYAAFAGGAAALTLLLALDSSVPWWLAARMGFGLCAAGIFAVAESWIADATPSERRGAVISVYQIVGRAGLILGPFLLAFPGVELTESFVIAGIFLALALIPVTATRRAQPAIPQGAGISPLRLFSIAPAAAVAAFAAGTVNSGVLAFAPLWAQTLDPARAGGAAAAVMAMIYFMSMLFQWPLGKLSDRMDRRLVIGALAGLSTVFAGLLAVFTDPGLRLGALMIGLWGAASLCYYGLSVAHAADRAAIHELPAIASGILLVWAAGSVIGPILAGLAYASPLESRGLFLFAAAVGFILFAAMFWRARVRKPAPAEDREPFVNLQATSAGLAEIDRPGSAAEPDYADPRGARLD